MGRGKGGMPRRRNPHLTEDANRISSKGSGRSLSPQLRTKNDRRGGGRAPAAAARSAPPSPPFAAACSGSAAFPGPAVSTPAAAGGGGLFPGLSPQASRRNPEPGRNAAASAGSAGGRVLALPPAQAPPPRVAPWLALWLWWVAVGAAASAAADVSGRSAEAGRWAK